MDSEAEDKQPQRHRLGQEPQAKERAALESLLDSMRDAGPPPRVRGTDLGAQSLPADLVDGFTLIEELGHGGQGVVYLAKQISTGREVALKLLREGPLADARNRRRFEREIEIVASLEHPNIVTLFGAGRTQEGHGWVAMEAVDGCNLRQHLQESNLDLSARLELLEQVSLALIEAHQHGVIHLDLKPANVLVKKDGQVRVVDFGLARSEMQESGSLSVDALGGTPGFMAPEQVRNGLYACDTRTDIHALGALLFFLMTGQSPYAEKESVFSSLEAVAAGELRDLNAAIAASEVAPTSARRQQDLLVVCRKALASEPNHRYSSVAEFLTDLQALNSGDPVTARHGERRYRWGVAVKNLRPVIFALIVAVGITWVSVSVALKQRALADLAEDNLGLATDNLKQAQANFEQAQEIAEAFLLEIDPLLSSLPGSGPAREKIIQRGTTYLEQLLQSAPDDASLRLKAARGLHAMARVQADVYTMSSGRLAEAFQTLEQFHKALPNAAELKSLSPGEQEFAFVLKVQANLLAARIARDLGLSQRYHDELLHAANSFADGSPFATFDARRTQSTVLEEWGRYLVSTNEIPKGREFIKRSRVVLDELVFEFSSNAKQMQLLQRDLTVLTFHEASLAKQSGDLVAAEDLLLKLHADTTDRLKKSESLTAMRDTSTAKERLVDIAVIRKDYSAGLNWLIEARQLRLKIVAKQPHHPSALASQISLSNRLGELHLASGDLDQASQWFDLFHQESLSFVDRFPEFARASRMLGVSHYKKHELALAQQNPKEALDALTKSLEIFQNMQTAGILSKDDAQVPAALLDEIKALELQLEGS